ncbi:MAG: Hpt domain-containing protein [Acidobacteria bacterium]|nr:Hpt domain-containing protein [Acidobacteriota bacterium]
MSENIDKELLITLATEIKDYLPKIIDNIELYRKDYNNVDVLRDAHRYVHTIKGASSMVGLSDLSHLAYYIEESFEEVLLGYLQIPAKMAMLVSDAVTLIDSYLDRLLLTGEVDSKQLFTQITDDIKNLKLDLSKQTECLPKKRSSIYEDEESKTGEFREFSGSDEVEDLDFTETFLPEGQEYWEAMCQNLTRLANNPTDKDLLEKIRRPAHALKGAAGMVGFQTIYEISLQMQKLLEHIQDSNVSPSPETIALLYSCINVIKSLLDTRKKDDPILAEQYKIKYKTLFSKLESFQPQTSYPSSLTVSLSNSNSKAIVDINEEKFLYSPGQTQELEDIGEELIDAFTEEAREHWQNISQALAGLAVRPSDMELLQEVRRHIHTLKGASNVVGFNTIGKLTHRMEDLLDYLHENEIAPTSRIINLLYDSSDAIEGFLTDRQYSDLSSLEDLFSQYKTILDNLALAEVVNDHIVLDIPTTPIDTTKVVDNSTRPLTSSSISSDILEIETLPTMSLTSSATAPLAPLSQINKDVTPQKDVVMDTFIAEAQEYLENISQNVQKLAKQPNDTTLLKEVRRLSHALKGAAAVVHFDTIKEIAFSMQTLLDKHIENNAIVSQQIIDLLFVSNDLMEDLLNSLETSNKAILEGILAQYKRWADDFNESTTTRSFPPIKREEDTSTLTLAELVKEQETLTQAPVFTANEEEKKTSTVERRKTEKRDKASAGFVRIPIERLDEIIKLVGELVINRSSFEQYFDNLIQESDELGFSIGRLRRIATKLESDYDVMALGGKVLPNRFSNPNQPFFLTSNFSRTTTSSAYEFDELEFDRYTEFNVSLKELLETSTDINTVDGELRNTIGDFDSYLNRLGRLTREVQDKLMQLRMIPLATLSSRLHRTVRTTANQQKKQVDLVIEGEEIELDKTVLEEIVDPLFHLMRNAVDHGIEPPALRQALGKPENGLIKLEAYYEGTQVIIKIIDDGGGINTSLVRSTIVTRGYLSETEAAQLTDEELFSYIFMPGFSTAKEVSEISGRGVGMDIVKAKVQKMKGAIGVSSFAGQGTVFTIQLPMTLAITRVLIVKIGKDSFAVPLGIINQIFRVELTDIQTIGNKKIVRVQNQIYPLIWLSDLLDLRQTSDELTKFPILITSIGERKVALAVDELLEQREVVIKNLGNHLRRLHGIMGATLMGDGSVVLILNLLELLQQIAKTQTKKVSIESKASLKVIEGVDAKEERILAQPFEMPSILEEIETFQENAQVIEAKLESKEESTLEVENAQVTNPPQVQERKVALKVLIVDDSLSVRTVISNLIKKTGWMAITAKDGMDALQVLQQNAELPDIILVDIEMPRMDGYELTSAIRADSNYKHLPVVMLTSRAGGKHRQRAMDAGVDEYLIKPYQDEVLLNTVRRLTSLE